MRSFGSHYTSTPQYEEGAVVRPEGMEKEWKYSKIYRTRDKCIRKRAQRHS